jgi:lycopene beta-cyclase
VPRPGARVVPIGTAAGMVKASTGYSFEAVQRWSAAVAADLVAGRPGTRHAVRSQRTKCMDRMFLSFMRRHPDRMPALFLRMFERVPPDAMVRFLSERGTLRDITAVAMALPVLPMLVEAARSLRLWARSA